MSQYTALLDANVLYPAPLRDLLMQLALMDMFHAKWTADIHREWIESLLENEPHRERIVLERTRDLMDRNIRDCLVTGYEHLIASLTLPDPDDRHVLAAAIVGRCDVIVTLNLKDFPNEALAPFGIEAQHPFQGRRTTSHERMTGVPWDASYRVGHAPWDIGRPQPAIARVVAEGGIRGPVLDAGCGTGENSLHVASLGFTVLGVDVAETALAMAREKAKARGIAAEFASADALHLEHLGRKFDTVLDCGLFHTFDAAERPLYVASLASVAESGATLYILCFSDQGPVTGPHPVREQDLRAEFSSTAGWSVAAIQPDRIHTRFHPTGAPAWFATIQRI